MKKIHQDAKNDRLLIVKHEFKMRYKKKSKVIYGFVEGKDDPCFYKGTIENQLPEGWKAEIWQLRGKDNIKKMYNGFDWSIFRKEQILFFYDKDLSEYIEEEIITDNNIYITDEYSIENNIVNYRTCDRGLRELWGFTDLEYACSESIETLFNDELVKFKTYCCDIMAIIIFWRRKGYKPCLNDILMKHIFKINSCKVFKNEKPKGKSSLYQYLSEQCGIHCSDDGLVEVKKEFIDTKGYDKFIRGKYLLWFLYQFCESVYNDYNNISFMKSSMNPKKTVSFSLGNFIVVIAPRVVIPTSLNSFYHSNIKKYMNLIAS